jgi:plasmid stabilization system protein ParE
MTYRIIIEPTAEREIRAAVRWKVEHASGTVAARWYDGLIKKIDTLRRDPSRCPLAAESDRFPEEIRELIHGRGGKRVHRHRILFTIREDAVHVLYVRHTARDEVEP